MNKNVVVIPIYREKIESELRHSIDRIISKIDMNKWDIIFICPYGFNYSEYMSLWSDIKTSTIEFWEGTIETYNKMLLNTNFYSYFLSYEYMLIIQDDVYLLRDSGYVDSFILEEWGYVGAPWFYKTYNQEKEMTGYKRYIIGRSKFKVINSLCVPRLMEVGNGGLSLRNIKKILCLLRKNKKYIKKWLSNEDGFFAYFGQFKEGFLPTVERAREFSLEIDAEEIMKKENIVPFGVHKWTQYYPNIERDYT